MSTNQVKTEFVEYRGWKRCVHMENGSIELTASTEFGPRILQLSLPGGRNIFYENLGQNGLTGGDDWRNYGGHRLWHGPQEGFRPNQPDNDPLTVETIKNGVLLRQPAEQATGIEKELMICLSPNRPQAIITHRMWNRGPWPLKFSAWALSMMAPGGLAVLPLPRTDTHFLPNYLLSFWPWTKPNDPRFTLTQEFLLLRQDPADQSWFKIGLQNHLGWGAYLWEDWLFLKRAPFHAKESYPDFGVNFELFTDGEFLELESLSPMQEVLPGEDIVQTETWELYPCPGGEEAALKLLRSQKNYR